MIIPNSQKSESGAPSSSTRGETRSGRISSLPVLLRTVRLLPQVPPLTKTGFHPSAQTSLLDATLHRPQDLWWYKRNMARRHGSSHPRTTTPPHQPIRWILEPMRRAQTLDSKTDPSVSLIDTRPNLMLSTTNGAISADVHVLSSDGMHAPPEQPLRIFASTTNGSIDIKIPASFEGALMMSTTWGCVNISEAIKVTPTTLLLFTQTS
ncbi:hypothetical protein RHS01_07717 [Rhizoctonia solani]|uniref:DUF7330 domain-containing protein n=1 Tax=Rhizoctonia solani TaxID=456999 RepID=A0A8H7I664_9AGAM|nr:hypothetical protein RHS01_07717 [Rhizoctonia solani]